MCPPPSHEAIAGPSPGHVVRYERIAAGARAALIRVTITLGEPRPPDVASAQLVAHVPGHMLRCDALPAPLPAEAPAVTLGFAAPVEATPLGLELAGRWLALPASGRAPVEAERQLTAAQTGLEASRAACVRIAHARDEALRAAARAEAAAHDASARARSLARRVPAQAAQPVRTRRRGSRLAAVAACALGPAALAVAILGWPARDGARERPVGGVSAARASAAPTRPRAAVAANPLAVRLQIPADYFALYRRAAARYGLDWLRLAAIGAIESGHGQAPLAGVATGVNGRGAAGPAQFLPGTWERFGLDGDGDGARDPHNPADAIPAMASYLRASGAPQDWRGALHSYNPSSAYVSAVEALAARLRRNAR